MALTWNSTSHPLRGYAAGSRIATAPVTPSIPSISQVTSPDDLQLVVHVTGIDDYTEAVELWVSETEAGEYILLTTDFQESFTVSVPAPLTSRWFRVQAINRWGESGLSAAASGTSSGVGTDTPGQVQNPHVASRTQTSITYAWDPLPGVTSYTIQMWDDSAVNWVAKQVTGLTTEQYTYTDLAPGTEYGIRVFGVNSNAAQPNGPLSVEVWSFTEAGAQAPVAGTITVTPDGTDTLVVAQATAGSGWDALSVQMSATGESGVFSEVATSLPYEEDGLAASTSRWFRVVYTNTSSGLSASSPVVQGTTLSDSPSGEIWKFDDFERPQLSGGPISWAANGNAYGELAVSTDRAKSGSRSIRMRFKASAPEQDSSVELRVENIGADLTEYCVRYWLYLPTNFAHRTAPGSSNNKGVLQSWSGPYSGNNQFIGFEYWPSASTPGRSNISCRMVRDGVDLGHGHGGGVSGSGVMFLPQDKGKWIQFKVHVKLASGPGQSNGTIRAWRWVQGNTSPELLYDKYDWGYCTRGNFIRSFYFLGWSNAGFDQTTDFYIDRMAIHTSLLDWEPMS